MIGIPDFLSILLINFYVKVYELCQFGKLKILCNFVYILFLLGNVKSQKLFEIVFTSNETSEEERYH